MTGTGPISLYLVSIESVHCMCLIHELTAAVSVIQDDYSEAINRPARRKAQTGNTPMGLTLFSLERLLRFLASVLTSVLTFQ